MVQRFVDDRFSHDDVNLDALFAVARGSHTICDGFQILHGEHGNTLGLRDAEVILGGRDFVVVIGNVIGDAAAEIDGGARGDGFGIEVVSIGGKNLVELSLKRLHGELHEELSAYKSGGGGILFDKVVHGGLQSLDRVKVVFSFLARAAEKRRCEFGIVPFGYERLCGVYVLFHHGV